MRARKFPWQRFWTFPITRILIFFLLFLGLALAAYVASGWFASKLSSSEAVVLPFLLEAVCALGAFGIMVRLVERRPLAAAGFTPRGMISETLTGYLIGFAVMSLTIGILSLTGVYQATGRNPAFQWVTPLLLFLCVAVAEETIFRGYVFQTLEQRWGTGVAFVTTALFFGTVHLFSSHGQWTGPVFVTFEAGILLGAAYLTTRRLWLPIGIHWAWNFFQGPFYGTTVSGSDLVTPLYQATLRGPLLLTGGAFGPEASVVCLVVCTAAGLLLLRIAVRSGQWRPGFATLVERKHDDSV